MDGSHAPAGQECLHLKLALQSSHAGVAAGAGMSTQTGQAGYGKQGAKRTRHPGPPRAKLARQLLCPGPAVQVPRRVPLPPPATQRRLKRNKLAWPTRDTASTSTSTSESLVVFHQAGSPNETSVYALYSCAFNASWCGTRAQALRQQDGTKPGKNMWVRGQTAAQPATPCQLQLAASAA